MKRNFRILKPIIVAIVLFVVLTLKDLLIEMTGGKIGDYLQENFGITITTLVYILIVILVLSLLYAIYEAFIKTNEKAEPKLTSEDIEPDVKKFYVSLKKRYRQRYESKLDGRFEIPLEVSEDWHSDKPKTYKFDAEAKISDAVEAVTKAFDDKGRLLIVGSPGSGKTVLLLKLARELLGDECKANQKLPVIFNLASWSKDYETFEDWLIDVLNSGNGLSKDFAKTVLRENRIIFLLDGLDELARNEDTETAHEKRAKCLDSLNDYLREGRKAVICCRREEFAEMQKTTNTDAPVSAKVEVLDLTKPDILLALQDARKHNESRESAKHLEEIIETNEVFLEVLSTPFYFTTALEVFDKHSLKETGFPTDADEVKKHLLDNFVESKISHTRNLIEFEKDKVKIKKWLKWLAEFTNRKQLPVFELADLQPIDLSRKFKFGLFMGIVGNLLIGLIGGFLIGLIGGFLIGLIGGFLIGLTGCFIIILFIDFDRIQTEDVVNLEYLKIFDYVFWKKVLLAFPTYSSNGNLLIGAMFGIVVAVILGTLGGIVFGTGKILNDATLGGTLGLLLGGAVAIVNCGVFSGIFFILVNGFEQIKNIKLFSKLEHPYQRLKGGFLINLYFSLILVICFVIIPLFGILYLQHIKVYSISILSLKVASQTNVKFEYNNISSDVYVPFVSLLISILIPYLLVLFLQKTPLFRHLILRFCLYLEDKTPLNYATFLDYMSEARILEKDGGHWRFRHQNLQDYFANLDMDS